MQRKVYLGTKGKGVVFRAKDKRSLIAKIKAAFPRVTNWEMVAYSYKPGCYLRGDDRSFSGSIVQVNNL